MRDRDRDDGPDPVGVEGRGAIDDRGAPVVPNEDRVTLAERVEEGDRIGRDRHRVIRPVLDDRVGVVPA